MSENLYDDTNKNICPYCQKEIEDKFFDDHMMCHELENEEQANNNNNNNNNINHQSNNNINNNGNNSNRNNNNRNNNSSNNNENSNGNFFSKIFNYFTQSNNDNQNNNNNSNNNNNEEGPSTLVNIFSTLSSTFSNINKLNQELNELSNQMNSALNSNLNNNNSPPPAFPNIFQNNPNPNSNNNRQFPSHLIFPSNFANLPIHNLIIGEPGHVFNPLMQGNNINIDAIMNLLPSSEIKEKKDGDNNNCIVCLNDFEIGDKVTSLPCLHMFHTDCIKNWLQSKNHCPICKYSITEESLRRGN